MTSRFGDRSDSAYYRANWAVSDWYLDGTIGLDTNNGTTALTPLRTGAELLRRLGPYAMWPQSVTVHVLANGMIDALVLRGVMLVAGTHIDIIGTPTVVATDSVLTWTNLNHAIPSATQLVANGIADWTPYVGMRVSFASGVSAGAVIWVGAANPGGAGLNIAQTTRTTRIDTVSTTALRNTGSINPVAGNTFNVETLPFVPLVDVYLDGQMLNSAGPQWDARALIIRDLDCPQMRIDSQDYLTYAKSLIFGCGLGIINSKVPAFGACDRTGCNTKFADPQTLRNWAGIFGQYFCCLFTVPDINVEFGLLASLTYCLFQNSRLNIRGSAAVVYQDLQFFDCTSLFAVFSLEVGTNVVGGLRCSGARNAGYGYWLANNIRGRFTQTHNLQAALGEVQFTAAPFTIITFAQAAQASDYAQKGTSGAMVAGTITITVPWYDNTVQRVAVSHAAFGGTPGILSVQQISTTQFTITSSSALDTSTVNWQISPLGRNIFISTV